MINRESGDALIHDRDSMRWLLFKDPLYSFTANHPDDVLPVIRKIQSEVKSKRLYAAGFISYDAAPGFDKALCSDRERRIPLLSINLYRTPIELDPEFLQPRNLRQTRPESEPEWFPCITEKEYKKGIESVKRYIQSGHTYQTNFTYRLTADLKEDSWDLFCRIQTAQEAGYGAYINTEDFTVCSASPELFFSLDGNIIRTRPMKGTAPRGLTLKEDRKLAESLFNSEKNRAENLMIVDMIRNDLGRIARTGTVTVPRLYNLEKYSTLWQMTSEIQAETDAEIPEILESLFPCASITGAPKCRTMEIIKETESTPRGLYTGSIGYWGPDRKAQFNVAIRTVVIEKCSGKALYGTGGGIVWDSTSESEYAESITKTKILTRVNQEFSLLETIKWSEDEGYFLLDRHLDRIQESAEYFDYPFDRESLTTKLFQESIGFIKNTGYRVRLLLDRSGESSIKAIPLVPSGPEPMTWRIKRAHSPIDRLNPLMYHKTTLRQIYIEFKASEPGSDDVLLWNERGEVTETTVCNVVVLWDGKAYTPPVSSGLLGGTLRQDLLEKGVIRERVITLDELEKAEEIYLVNSVRGRINVLLE